MRSTPVHVTTEGSAGAATGSAKSQALRGLLSEIWINFDASAPVTTTVTFTETVNGVTRTILAFTGNTDTCKAIGLPVVDASDTEISGASRLPYLEESTITVTVTASDALDPAVTVMFSLVE